VTPLSAAHRTPGKRRVALQEDVRSGGNRFAYISRYKSFSGLANRVSENQWLRKFANFFSVRQDASNHPCDKHKNRLFDKKKYKNIPRDISKRETRDSTSTSTPKI